MMGGKKKRFLGIIPARAGSKGIPQKNVRPFRGVPLIAHTIRAAMQATLLDDVIVTTDGEAIRDVCLSFGAKVPFTRPPELATDEASTKDVILHALQAYDPSRSFDAIVLLQPTCPLRGSGDIDQGIRRFLEEGRPSLISLYEANHCHPFIMYRRNGEGEVVPLLEDQQGKRRQAFFDVYVRNGALYIVDQAFLHQEGKLISDDSAHLVMPRERSVNIDTPADWALAEFYHDQLAVAHR
jgi:CMP-N,N'-diacetyllegionaminic acid synthase